MAYFSPHVPTLTLAMASASFLVGWLLLFTWMQTRTHAALLWWSASYLLTAVGIAMVAARGAIPIILSVDVGNAIMIAAYGSIWCGVCSFQGRDIRIGWVVFAALMWVMLRHLPFAENDYRARIGIVSALVISFIWLSAYELWKGRSERLRSRWPAIVLLGAQSVLMAVRTPLVYSFDLPPEELLFSSDWFGAIAFGALLYVVALSFLFLALTKERTELHLKHQALVDSLTGIWNRRAFLEESRRAILTSKPRAGIAVLVFDLDRFKQINDRYGHPFGDLVLSLFAQTLAREVGTDGFAGRLGGEEFAAMLPDHDLQRAIAKAERIRAAFASDGAVVETLSLAATVSVGISYAVPPVALEWLLAAADDGVYRAKAAGRNCVRIAPRPAAVTGIDLTKAAAQETSSAA